MGDTTSTTGTDDRLATRAVALVAALTAPVTSAALPPKRVARWAWAHDPGEENRAAAAVLWADLGDWCRDVAEALAATDETRPR